MPLPPSPAGRYAPSPSGDLHLGNLRTALLAWLYARSTGRRFLLRVEDIDTQRSSAEAARRQCADLEALGLHHDGAVLYQHDRFPAYEDALRQLHRRGLLYECYCSRRDIREAARAPHTPPGMYPGTCRDLDEEERDERRRHLRQNGRVPALRLRAATREWTITDMVYGQVSGAVDDVIVRRGGSGTVDWAYNLAVVVDDAYQGVDQVVRGDDLLFSAPAQAYLAHELGVPQPHYAHVPLVLNEKGERLAKRDGAVTLRQLATVGMGPRKVLHLLAESLGLPPKDSPDALLPHFDPAVIPREPWIWRMPQDPERISP